MPVGAFNKGKALVGAFSGNIETSRMFVDSSILLTRLRLRLSPHSSHIISRILMRSRSLTFIKTSFCTCLCICIFRISYSKAKAEQNQTSYASIIRGKSYFKVHFIALGIAASLLWNLKHIFNVDTIHSKDMVTFPHALISTSGG